MSLLTEEEKFAMMDNMRKYGGSFVQALAEAFARADVFNFHRLELAFPELVERYKNWGK